MPHIAASLTPENPFCTGRTRPGALPFLFPGDDDAGTLVRRLRQSRWEGEIIGPHGTGKSTLLASLLPELERAGQRPLSLELHDGERWLPLDPDRRHRLHPFTILVIDGYEQLRRLTRWRLRRLCHRRGWGLLVTAHVSVGLPAVFQTSTTPALTRRIVDMLLPGMPRPFTDEELVLCFARHRGDVREMLFDLYDLFESRRPSSGQKLT
ncbi:MAG: hypothetical protein LLG00_13855 [Planctomycetaceae bacterium]|nr:hypothetical protein [Planctomycetaceae bacterium]